MGAVTELWMKHGHRLTLLSLLLLALRCLQVHTDGTPVKDYEDLQPHECGFLGISFLCAESEGTTLLKRIKSYNIRVDTVDDEVYGQQVLLLRDPQNIPIRIALTN